MQSQPPNVCFYSNKCDWSRAFIEELAKTPWKSDFRFLCVDAGPDGKRPPLPKWLSKVPTLVIRGEEEPRTDNQVMNWLYEKKQTLRGGGGGGGGGDGGGPVRGAPAPEDVEGFTMNEMGARSVGYQYSFVDADSSPGGNGGLTMPGNFEFLGGSAAPGDRAMQQIGDSRAPGGSNGGRSKKELMFDKQMEAYQRERDAALPQKARRV
jgi:hypothetical protein